MAFFRVNHHPWPESHIHMKSKKGPGKAFREGISLFDLVKRFPNEQSAIDWFESIRWKDGRTCPKCGSCDTYETKNANGMRYRCRDCRRYFSVKTGTVLQSSKLPLQKWVFAIFLELTSLKAYPPWNSIGTWASPQTTLGIYCIRSERACYLRSCRLLKDP